MTELEKLDAGKPYYFLDDEVAARKANAARLCQEFNEIPATEPEKQTAKIKQIFGKLVNGCQFSPRSIAIMARTSQLAKTF